MAVVRLSHLADIDLDDIRDYIAQHNPRAANKVLDQLVETLEHSRHSQSSVSDATISTTTSAPSSCDRTSFSTNHRPTESTLRESSTALEIIPTCFISARLPARLRRRVMIPSRKPYFASFSIQ
jgi:ParE toxin of type II toxin-antitoxin system, parDE